MSEMLVNGQKVAFNIDKKNGKAVITLGPKTFDVSLAGISLENLVLKVGDSLFQVPLKTHKEKAYLIIGGKDVLIESPSKVKKKGEAEGHMLSPMPGKILRLMVSAGDEIKKGDTLLIMEAMKMEHKVKASKNGKVLKVFYAEGEQVEGGIELVEMES